MKKRNRFKKGNKLAKGGARKGAGKKPDWFKHFCEQELKKKNLAGIRKVGEISRGEAKFEKVFNDEGTIVRAEIGPSEAGIIKANEFLRDSAGYKPKDSVEHSGRLTLEDLVAGSSTVTTTTTSNGEYDDVQKAEE